MTIQIRRENSSERERKNKEHEKRAQKRANTLDGPLYTPEAPTRRLRRGDSTATRDQMHPSDLINQTHETATRDRMHPSVRTIRPTNLALRITKLN